jgi:hypothetical protein
VSVVLGAWLFISAFVWPHTPALRADTWIVGALIFLVGITAMYTSPARYVNTLLGVYLFISTLAFHHVEAGTVWNNLIVAVIVFVVSLIPSGVPPMHRPGRAAHAH